MKILHLTLKKKYFDMIASGVKKEEYRELKPYWVKRLAHEFKGHIGGDFMDRHAVISYTFKDFDAVRFTNGYSKNAPSMLIGFEDIDIRTGKPEWGAVEGEKYFVISLGKIKEPTTRNTD
jgi:hypothetical protein